MATHGDKFGQQKGRGDWGKGNFLRELPQHGTQTFGDFSGGLDARTNRERTPENASYDTLDMLVSPANELIRAPGADTIETLADRDPLQLALHPSLSHTSELVMFDPPYIGIKTAGDTNWINVGLVGADRRFFWANYGETFVFGNRARALLKREPGTLTVETLDKAPQGVSLATFASRLFVGGAYIEGKHEPVGMAWNTPSGDLNDWTGDGAGFELLIDDMNQGDKIVALRTMGLNLMAILMRKSIWIGRFTGNLNRPAAFEPRIPGVGCANEQTARNTKYGVMFLSDTGVQLFDGNSVEMVSGQINKMLLPLDKTKLVEYSAVYSPLTRQYKLLTPTGTFIFDLEYKRWYRSSLIARSAVVFPTQIVAASWDSTAGSWEDHLSTVWDDLVSAEEDGGSIVYLGVQTGVPRLAKENPATETYLGATLTPYWSFPFQEGPMRHFLFTTHAVLLDYVGGGSVRVYLPNYDGDFAAVTTQPLEATSNLRTAWVPVTSTGKGVSAKLEITAGSPRISVVQLRSMLRGPRIAPIVVDAPPPPDSILTVNKSAIEVSIIGGCSDAEPQLITWSNPAGLAGLVVTTTAPWLNLVTVGDITTVTIDPTDLVAGVYNGTIIGSQPGSSGSPRLITVQLTVLDMSSMNNLLVEDDFEEYMPGSFTGGEDGAATSMFREGRWSRHGHVEVTGEVVAPIAPYSGLRAYVGAFYPDELITGDAYVQRSDWGLPPNTPVRVVVQMYPVSYLGYDATVKDNYPQVGLEVEGLTGPSRHAYRGFDDPPPPPVEWFQLEVCGRTREDGTIDVRLGHFDSLGIGANRAAMFDTVRIYGPGVVVPPPESPETLSLSVGELSDASELSTLVSGGIFLADASDPDEFYLTEEEVDDLGLFVNDIEVSVLARSLLRARDDGSLRTVHLQFAASPGDTVELRKGARTLAPRVLVEFGYWNDYDEPVRIKDEPWKVGFNARFPKTSAAYARKTGVLGPLCTVEEAKAIDPITDWLEQKIAAHEPHFWDHIPGGIPGKAWYNSPGLNPMYGYHIATAVKWLRPNAVNPTYDAGGGNMQPQIIAFNDYSNSIDDHQIWRLGWNALLDGNQAVNYYDRALIFLQMWLRTGDDEWLKKAHVIQWHYHTQNIIRNFRLTGGFGTVSGQAWCLQPEGTLWYYALTGSNMAREAILAGAEMLYMDGASGYFNDQNTYTEYTPEAPGSDFQGHPVLGFTAADVRGTSRTNQAYACAEMAKGDNLTWGGNPARDWKALLQSRLDRIAEANAPNRSLVETATDAYYRYTKPLAWSFPTEPVNGFMEAVITDALLFFRRHYPTSLGSDRIAFIERIIPKLSKWLYENFAGVSTVNSGSNLRFRVYNVWTNEASPDQGNVDLVRMHAHQFAATHVLTGDSVWRDRALQVMKDGAGEFSHTGLEDAGMGGNKQFTENWFRYNNAIAYLHNPDPDKL